MRAKNELFLACVSLFAAYPAAVTADNAAGTVRRMSIVVRPKAQQPVIYTMAWHDGLKPYFTLLRQGQEAGSRGITIDPRTTAGNSDLVVRVLSKGVPIPRSGSIFGWVHGDVITALDATYIGGGGAIPDFTPLARVGAKRATWSELVGNGSLGTWFWDRLKEGRLLLLNEAIAKTSGLVYWIVPPSGVGYCLITSALGIPNSRVHIPAGTYVYHEFLDENGAGFPAGQSDDRPCVAPGLDAGPLADLRAWSARSTPAGYVFRLI